MWQAKDGGTMRKILFVALVVAVVAGLGGNIAQYVNHKNFQKEAWKYVSNLQMRLDHPIQYLTVPGECPEHSHIYSWLQWPTTYKQDR